MFSIAIIGGGLSGTLVAIELLRKATAPLTIYVIERSTDIGHGVAYSTHMDCHLLNVPVKAVSTDPNDPNHFLRWLHAQGKSQTTPEDFVPRRWFGSYIKYLLADAIAHSRHATFEGIKTEAIDLTHNQSQVQVQLRNSRTLTVDGVVLALGNPPPANVPIPNPEFYDSDRYVSSGWLCNIETILEYPSVFLIGAGLTTVDWLVALKEKHYTGQIHVLSRHGLLPQSNRLTANYPTNWLKTDFPKSTLGLVRWVRREVKQAAPQGHDWRAILDTLRPHLQTLWVSLPAHEKRRFTRHIRPFWDSHRHRIAPQISEIVAALKISGQLQLHTAHLCTCQTQGNIVQVILRQRGGKQLETLEIGIVVNCTGPQFDYHKLEDPLIQSLILQGLIRPNFLKLGIDAAGDGAVLDAEGNPSKVLYTLGPTRRGELWETTAVTEIRDQAIALGHTLLSSKVAP